MLFTISQAECFCYQLTGLLFKGTRAYVLLPRNPALSRMSARVRIIVGSVKADVWCRWCLQSPMVSLCVLIGIIIPNLFH